MSATPHDPLERRIADALTRASLRFVTDRDGANPSGLDFALPDYRIEIEVKRMHSPRIAEQMGRAPNVIVAQGEIAVDFLARAIVALGAQIERQDIA